MLAKLHNIVQWIEISGMIMKCCSLVLILFIDNSILFLNNAQQFIKFLQKIGSSNASIGIISSYQIRTQKFREVR